MVQFLTCTALELFVAGGQTAGVVALAVWNPAALAVMVRRRSFLALRKCSGMLAHARFAAGSLRQSLTASSSHDSGFLEGFKADANGVRFGDWVSSGYFGSSSGSCKPHVESPVHAKNLVCKIAVKMKSKPMTMVVSLDSDNGNGRCCPLDTPRGKTL